MGALKKKTGVAYAVNAVLVVILFVVLLVWLLLMQETET